MAERPARCLILSDFNVGVLRGLLANDAAAPAVEATSGPYGQVTEPLVDAGHPAWAAEPDVALVWTRPQAVSEAFARLLASGDAAPDRLVADVDRFCALVSAAKGRARNVFVPTWTQPPHQRGLGPIDLTHPRGVGRALAAMNARLVENLSGVPGVFVLDAQRWMSTAGAAAYSDRMWHLAKVPFSNAVFGEAVADVKAALLGIAGKARKLVILDLDDTLWGGIVGDVGWEHLRLGGHDAIGEAFVEFQRALKGLQARGIVLGIVSKNEESVALEAIRRHPDMVLRLDDFAGWRINWSDKARNLLELVEELNLGLQSVVFIDDNPVERDRVRQSFPEVLVPDWPEDKMLYGQALARLRCFDVPSISEEDRTRASMYAADRQRRDLARELGSVDDWLAGLGIRISAERLSSANLSRAAQLFNKTNQMNLSTRRLTGEELWAWSQAPGHALWTLRVSDKFGDAGLVGIVSVAADGAAAQVVDFILSCRVFGRRVEEAMLHVAIRHARAAGARSVAAQYLATPKNKPTLSFLQRSGLAAGPGDRFSWAEDRDYPAPQLVSVELAEPDGAR